MPLIYNEVMPKRNNKKRVLILASTIIGLAVCTGLYFVYAKLQDMTPVATTEQPSITTVETSEKSPSKQSEPYTGESVIIGGRFSVKVPDGWVASISEKPSFLAIMFARPNQLHTLIYTTGTKPTIDYAGIPSWSGLTDAFFIIAPTDSLQFTPSDHLEISSEPFQFADGFLGEKYTVIKHATEAQKWGGLQRDNEWQGRTYIYEKDGKRVEAHLALYPSTSISLAFYEDVVKTVRF